MQDQDQPISDNPWQSPPRGRTFNERQSQLSPSQNIFRVVAIGVVCIGVYYAATNAPSSSLSDAERAEQAFTVRVQDVVKRELKDPESARFEAVSYFPAEDVACGSVNAKNSYGGYTGKEDFVYSHGRAELISGDAARYIRLSQECRQSMKQDTVARLENTIGLYQGLINDDPNAAAKIRKLEGDLAKAKADLHRK